MSHCYYADIDHLDDRDVNLHAAPLSHGSGLYALPHIAKGSHHIIMSGSFEPDRIFDVLEKHQHVTMFGAPTMVSRLINHRRAGSADTSGLKTLYFGGAPMYVSDLKKALEIFGPKLTQIYGQGESPMTISFVSKRLLGQTRPSSPRGDSRLLRRAAHRRRRHGRRRGRPRAARRARSAR